MKKLMIAGIALLALGSVAHATCDEAARANLLGRTFNAMVQARAQGNEHLAEDYLHVQREIVKSYLDNPDCQENRDKVQAIQDMMK